LSDATSNPLFNSSNSGVEIGTHFPGIVNWTLLDAQERPQIDEDIHQRVEIGDGRAIAELGSLDA